MRDHRRAWFEAVCSQCGESRKCRERWFWNMIGASHYWLCGKRGCAPAFIVAMRLRGHRVAKMKVFTRSDWMEAIDDA